MKKCPFNLPVYVKDAGKHFIYRWILKQQTSGKGHGIINNFEDREWAEYIVYAINHTAEIET